MNSPIQVSSSNGALGIQISYASMLPNFFALLASIGVTEFTLKPNSEEIIFRGCCNNHPLYLPCDTSISTKYLASRCYDIDKIKFFGKLIGGYADKRISFIDVGANVGLITRQLHCLYPKAFQEYFCYEPEPSNFKLLSQNVNFLPRCRIFEYGLGASDGMQSFFIDKLNKGNHSYCQAAVDHMDNVGPLEAKVASPLNEINKWLSSSDFLVWKSDTQGMDEMIASQLPFEFWSKYVIGGSMEIWNIPKQEYDLDYLCKIFDLFSVKFSQRTADAELVRVSTGEIREFIEQGTRNHDRSDMDILFSKSLA